MIIGLDVGGTHTDVVLLDKDGLLKDIKVPTVETDLFHTVLSGIEQISQGIKPSSIERIVLSTTLTTNAIVQQKQPDFGMIVLSGPGIDPEAFRTHDHYYTVAGALDHRGREIEPIDFEALKTITKKLRADGIRHVGVVGKFSARNPMHEQKVREMLKKSFRKVFLGHWISGSLNFPRRIATTFLNASVYPIHKNFFEAVQKTLEKQGLQVPIHILKADGGTMSFPASINYPGQTILSGPAASVMGAIPFAGEDEEALVLDIGGTTTDIAVILNKVPVLEPLGIELAGYKTLIRALKTRSIGLGGDSHITVEDGEIRIGPMRAGHAMAFGGPEPTPTDALCVLEKMTHGDRDKAVQGIRKIAEALDAGILETAERIYEHFCSEVVRHARKLVADINSKPVYTVHEHWEGHQVRPDKILVLGGPAKHFAPQIESISGLSTRVVPKWNVANAIGAAFARTTSEVNLFADTQRGILTAPEERFFERIDSSFSREDAVEKALSLLKQKAIRSGAAESDLEMEILENLQFNMVRGFSAAGRNIRIKVQVKPGLVHGYEVIAKNLANEMTM
ncbi:MAG: hydantoinase/oxoprolinase family protein [Thermodesulfobacteriota bacterium]|nr:hydantoinase/oxoprolinase family protein [Thermodesulfobacteriota bacterium]